MRESNEILNEVTESEYKYGFTTNIETEVIAKGLNEDTIDSFPQKRMSQNGY